MVMRTLTEGDFDAVHTAFNEAFRDYVVPLQLTPEQFREMLTRRGWVPEASVAAEDERRIVAFTLNCIDGTAAYDNGTGVVPTHRRRGLAARVMNECVRVLRARGCETYVLEVIDTNHGAIALYESLGFQDIRGLQSWTYESKSGREAEVPNVNLRPSWQNSEASIRRATAPHVKIEDARGHLLLFPNNGDVPRFHGTITTRLLDEALAAAGKPLRIINVDESDEAFARFLAGAGARKIVRQREMILPL